MYNAVIISQLVYGLETMYLNDSLFKRLDAFQLRGLRQIMKIETTWAQKKEHQEMTNKKNMIYERAAKILHPREDRYMFYNETHKRWQYAETHWKDECKPPSQVYTENRREPIASIIRAGCNVITTQTTNPQTQPPNQNYAAHLYFTRSLIAHRRSGMRRSH